MTRLQAGYGYVEVMVAALLLSIALIPAADALRDTVMHDRERRNLMSASYATKALLETVLTEPFADLQAQASATGGVAPSAYSDVPSATPRRLIWVRPYDADNADGDDDISTGADDGIVQVVAEAQNTGIRFVTLVVEGA